MKFFKVLFSKYIPVGLLLVLQILIFFVMLIEFEEYLPAFQILSAVAGVLIFFKIVNKKETPEYKIPWIVLILLLPLFGIAIYLLFANQKIKPKDAKKLNQLYNEMIQYVRPSEKEKANISSFLGENLQLSKYLTNTSHTYGALGNDIKYFSVGEEFWEDYLIELKKAKKFIFLEYFIIEHGKMWDSIHEILLEKISEGVEVKILYDDVGVFGKLKDSYHRKLRKEGIECYKFARLTALLSAKYNNRDHRKITIIDGKVAYTGGINISDDYVNITNRLGHWKDTAIKIKGSAVNTLTMMFLTMFDITSKKSRDYKKYFPTHNELSERNGFIHPFGSGPIPYYKEQVGENNYINLINSAKKYVWLTTPYLIIDHNLTSALRNAAKRGVDVRIITPHTPDKKIVFMLTRSSYAYLIDAGVKIYEYMPGFIHAKMCLVDDNLAYIGSINLDYRSLTHHYECGALLVKCPCLNDMKMDFVNTLNASMLITSANFKLNGFVRIVASTLQLISTMF